MMSPFFFIPRCYCSTYNIYDYTLQIYAKIIAIFCPKRRAIFTHFVSVLKRIFWIEKFRRSIVASITVKIFFSSDLATRIRILLNKWVESIFISLFWCWLYYYYYYTHFQEYMCLLVTLVLFVLTLLN